MVPDILFDERKLAQTLNGFAPAKTSDKESVFYKAILQNLFFATLNTEMDKRGWTKEEQNFMAHSLYRHNDFFQKPNDALDLFKTSRSSTADFSSVSTKTSAKTPSRATSALTASRAARTASRSCRIFFFSARSAKWI